MGRGKDRKKRTMNPASLTNLHTWEQVRPAGLDDVQVRVYLPPADARAWRKLSPTERGRLVQIALQVRENGG